MAKSKKRFHAHHPNRKLFPDYTIPLCPSCHGRVTAEEKKAKTAGGMRLSSQPRVGSLPWFRNLEEAVRYLEEERKKRDEVERNSQGNSHSFSIIQRSPRSKKA
ncbi:MAG: hypothetical protein QW356_08245 [Candidatus Hadarchaeales archaeon]